MGDVTSGGVQDDAAANADISGGGGDSSSNYSYSDLGQSPGAMGGVQVGGETRLNEVSPTSVPTVSPPSTSFSLGFGGSPEGTNIAQDYMNNYMNDLNALTGSSSGGGSSDDGGGSDTTVAALRRGAPALIASNAAEEAVQTAVAQPKFMFDYGFGDAGSPQIDDRPRPDPNEIKNKGIIDPIRTVPAGSPNDFQNIIYPIGTDPFAPIGDDKTPPSPTEMTDFITPILPTPAARPSIIDTQPKTDANAAAAKIAALARSGSGGAKTQEELNLLQRLGRFLKGVGKSISNFEMSDIFEFLKGDPNYKGPSPAQQQLMGVPGPGPFVGGGVPSPSGGSGGGMPAKDPCPPGFRFDPTLQQCVPIIAPNKPTDTTTAPTTPTTPAPGVTPPVAGGIADAYPFVLTPPIGTPVGNLPPVRLTT